MKFKVLYNPLANIADEKALDEKLAPFFPNDELKYFNITKIENYAEFLSLMKADETLMLVGGDGTLNRFVNDTDGLRLPDEIWYYAAGRDNAFWHDIGKTDGDKPARIERYLKILPTVAIGEKTYKFINGVGYGLDGHTSALCAKLKENGKAFKFKSVALKEFLFKYKLPCATVTVGDDTQILNKVWFASTMNGRYGKGGLKTAPNQNRFNAERDVTLCVMHGKGRFTALFDFLSVFKGKHTAKKSVKSVVCKNVKVAFDRPVALEIDGEIVPDVSEYTVTAGRP